MSDDENRSPWTRPPPDSFFYLSFGDAGRWLGSCVVRARTFEEAVREAWRREINPGGEVLGVEVPDGVEVTEKHLDRLIVDRAEAEGLFSDG